MADINANANVHDAVHDVVDVVNIDNDAIVYNIDLDFGSDRSVCSIDDSLVGLDTDLDLNARPDGFGLPVPVPVPIDCRVSCCCVGTVIPDVDAACSQMLIWQLLLCRYCYSQR
jgi:hypothetical protein